MARASGVGVRAVAAFLGTLFSARAQSVPERSGVETTSSTSASSWAAESSRARIVASRARRRGARGRRVWRTITAVRLAIGDDRVNVGSTPVLNARIADLDTLANGIEQDEAWALVRTVADVSRGTIRRRRNGARPGSAERATLDPTAAERSELMALLAEETRRSGA